MLFFQMSSTTEKSTRGKWMSLASILSSSKSFAAESGTPSSAPSQSDVSTDKVCSTYPDAGGRTSADPAKVSVSGAVYANC
jgi:hypothetical protein